MIKSPIKNEYKYDNKCSIDIFTQRYGFPHGIINSRSWMTLRKYNTSNAITFINNDSSQESLLYYNYCMFCGKEFFKKEKESQIGDYILTDKGYLLMETHKWDKYAYELYSFKLYYQPENKKLMIYNTWDKKYSYIDIKYCLFTGKELT